MSEFITVKISLYPADLAIAKTYLEDNDVFCFIKDEFITQVHPFYSNAVGGAKLQVPEEDAEKAIHLLIDGGFTKKEDYEQPIYSKHLIKFVDKLESIFGKKKE